MFDENNDDEMMNDDENNDILNSAFKCKTKKKNQDLCSTYVMNSYGTKICVCSF